MKLRPLLLACLLTGVAAPAAPTSDSLVADQEIIRVRVAELSASYRELGDALRELGAPREDVDALDNALSTLARLHREELPRVVELLRTGEHATALEAQMRVAGILRDLSVALQQRQQELALARQARALGLRQAANRRRTDALRLGASPEGARAFLLAEQDALRAETLALIDRFTRLLATPAGAPSESLARLATPDFLAGLRAETERAAERTRALDYRPALAAQLLAQDRLLRLASLGRGALELEEAVRLAVQEIDALAHAQGALREASNTAGADPADLGWEQDKLTGRADALRPDVDGLSAPAGHALREAADAMHAGRLQFAQARSPRVLPAQDTALARLETARAHLLALLEARPQAETPPTPEELRELARRAEELARRQAELARRSAATSEDDQPGRAAIERSQAELARQTAGLQEQARAQGSEAAEDLGHAASRMTEANAQADTNLIAADAAAQAAAEHLAQAADQLQRDAAAAARAQAAAAVAQAAGQLENAAEQLAAAEQASDAASAAQAAQAAGESLAEARAELARSAGQGGPSDSAERAALSEAWSAVNEASAATAAGDVPTAAEATARARQALARTQSSRSGQRGGGQADRAPPGELAGAGEAAAETVGAPPLTPAQREAVSAARRQPAPAAYAGLVEAYFDALNEDDQ